MKRFRELPVIEGGENRCRRGRSSTCSVEESLTEVFPSRAKACSLDGEPASLAAALKGFAGTFPTNAGVFMTTHWSVVAELPRREAKLRARESAEGAHAVVPGLLAAALPICAATRLQPSGRRGSHAGIFRLSPGEAGVCDLRSQQGAVPHFSARPAEALSRRDDAHQRRQKRGGDQMMIFLDAERLDAVEEFGGDALSTAAPLDEERVFEWNWAVALVGRAMEELKAEYSSGQKARVFSTVAAFPYRRGGFTYLRRGSGLVSACRLRLCAAIFFVCDRAIGRSCALRWRGPCRRAKTSKASCAISAAS